MCLMTLYWLLLYWLLLYRLLLYLLSLFLQRLSAASYCQRCITLALT